MSTPLVLHRRPSLPLYHRPPSGSCHTHSAIETLLDDPGPEYLPATTSPPRRVANGRAHLFSSYSYPGDDDDGEDRTSLGSAITSRYPSPFSSSNALPELGKSPENSPVKSYKSSAGKSNQNSPEKLNKYSARNSPEKSYKRSSRNSLEMLNKELVENSPEKVVRPKYLAVSALYAPRDDSTAQATRYSPVFIGAETSI
jgi:hypothetical protein